MTTNLITFLYSDDFLPMSFRKKLPENEYSNEIAVPFSRHSAKVTHLLAWMLKRWRIFCNDV